MAWPWQRVSLPQLGTSYLKQACHDLAVAVGAFGILGIAVPPAGQGPVLGVRRRDSARFALLALAFLVPVLAHHPPAMRWARRPWPASLLLQPFFLLALALGLGSLSMGMGLGPRGAAATSIIPIATRGFILLQLPLYLG